MMQKVLNQANEEGHTSIALPAIGTGNLGFPGKVTAQLMYEEALTFSQQNPSGSLTDIRFVVYQKDNNTIKVKFLFSIFVQYFTGFKTLTCKTFTGIHNMFCNVISQ